MVNICQVVSELIISKVSFPSTSYLVFDVNKLCNILNSIIPIVVYLGDTVPLRKRQKATSGASHTKKIVLKYRKHFRTHVDRLFIRGLRPRRFRLIFETPRIYPMFNPEQLSLTVNLDTGNLSTLASSTDLRHPIYNRHMKL
ncbi:hypothetical protein NQ317_017302 [Molorchus minor]|uniref:Uncharacterized protein n=1 Tax=Molorchus minor TaxID=1323400 RepID=A0ABQ9JTP5_9CUCU|nr:hypothetical protein NQ317_017302 [Molorchus minor]